MTPYDRGIRDLVPLFLEDPDELGYDAEEDADGAAFGPDISPIDAPAPRSSEEAMRLPELSAHTTAGPTMPTQYVLSSSSQIDQLPAQAAGPDIVAPSTAVEPGLFDQSFIKYPVSAGAYGDGGHSPADDASVPESSGDHPVQTGMDPPAQTTDGGAGVPQQSAPIGSEGLVEGTDGEHDIAVTQTADVDQDATIVVQGYMGSVVSRFHIDQKILMDQDADIDVNMDGNGHFAITIDQKMYINQQTDVDLKVFDEDGVLYVDLYLRDVIEVDQDTSVLFNMYDGFGDNDLVIIQDLDMDQDVDVDIDVEDELEERYDVKVDVSVLQDADADEDANLHITNHAGELEVDLEANQVANIDQETFVKIDFALV
jgi:uncharacterized protein YdeI (BOF family)